jgi:hypothetical protein
MSRHKHFLSKCCVPFLLWLFSQQPLFGAEQHGAVQAETGSPSANDSKVQSGSGGFA